MTPPCVAVNPTALWKRPLLPLGGKLSPASLHRQPPLAGKPNLRGTTLMPRFHFAPAPPGTPISPVSLPGEPSTGPHLLSSWSKGIQKSWWFQLCHTNSRREAAWLIPAPRTWTLSISSWRGGEGLSQHHSVLWIFLPAMDRSDYRSTNLTVSRVRCAEHIYLSKVKLRR